MDRTPPSHLDPAAELAQLNEALTQVAQRRWRVGFGHITPGTFNVTVFDEESQIIRVLFGSVPATTIRVATQEALARQIAREVGGPPK
jgi:hypothetical protein